MNFIRLKIQNLFILFCLTLPLLLLNYSSYYKLNNDQQFRADTTAFYDSAHHWYDINNDDKIILPDSNQRRYSPYEMTKIEDNILLFQKSNGGWPKNYDMRAILNRNS